MTHTPLGTPSNPCNRDKDRSCNICDGGLSLCTVCGGAEGSMPTACPGYKLTREQLDDIYAGKLDFLDINGVVEKQYFP